jgi:hypothetical protein
MKLITNLTALSLVICASMLPLTAQAGNNYQNQQMILSNFNTQEQILANQINSYVSSGQLSPQQGSAFSGELNQIASQSLAGATNPSVTVLVMSELSSLASQITASLGSNGQWYAPPVWGSVRGPGRYSWRPRHGVYQQNVAVQNQYNSGRAAGQRQLETQQRNARNGMRHQEQANNSAEHANIANARANEVHQQQDNRMNAHNNEAHARAATEQQPHASVAHAQPAHEKSNVAREEHR